MPQLDKNEKEESELDEYVLLAGIAVRKNCFWPKPLEMQPKEVKKIITSDSEVQCSLYNNLGDEYDNIDMEMDRE